MGFKALNLHTKRLRSMAVSIFAIGGIAGGFSSGYVADKLGRKTALLLNNVVALIATGFFVFAKVLDIRYLFTIGRCVCVSPSGVKSLSSGPAFVLSLGKFPVFEILTILLKNVGNQKLTI